MKKIAYLFFVIVLNFLRTNAQDNQSTPYKVPDAYRFDYKVVYELINEDKKTTETATYYFTKNGEYMSIQTSDIHKNEGMNFMIMTKDGMMVTFEDNSKANSSDNNHKVLKVIDMKSMYKGLGEGMTALSKAVPKNEDSDKAETKTKTNDLDNFVRTGKTKQFFGYSAEEYSKHFSKSENGKQRSGTLYVWYAKVDFNPESMFSQGLVGLANGQREFSMHNSHSGNLLGMGIEKKDYLPVEIDYAEDGGNSGTAMKVVSLEKTDFSKLTAGYKIENYSGMTMSQMIQKEREENK
jgi:hypothetical protein